MFDRILRDLSSPDAYPHPTDTIRIAQTHISCVFLTGRFAYKIKKPVRFAFLDYSTAEKRRRMSLREVELNRRLCPTVYLDVLPVVVDGGRLKIGGRGEPVDWAVQMRQLSDRDMLAERLRTRTVGSKDLDRIARVLAQFHDSAEHGPQIDEFGQPDKLALNTEENFAETESRSDDILPSDHLRKIEFYTRNFLTVNKDLFLKRVKEGWIRDGHGDLRIQNVCLQPEVESGVQVFDCIEFNDRLRFLDVASDIAYLAMDFDLAGRADLRWKFLQTYRSALRDEADESLFRFYCCYRAYVRGKIALFASEEKEIPEKERDNHSDVAHASFDLARSYSRAQTAPTLVIMVGYSGSGKSAIAEQLARRMPAVILATDVLRKQMAGVDSETKLGPEWYTEGKIAETYGQMRQAATQWLQRGENVILDATFISQREREKAADVASACGAKLRIIHCDCPDEWIRQRLKNRPAGFSDADIAVYEVQKQLFEPLANDSSTIKILTDRPSPVLAREILLID